MLYVSIFVELLRSRPSLAVWLAALAQALLWLLVPALFYAGPPGDVPDVLAVGHEFQLGTYLGPPLAFWLAELAFDLAGRSMIGVYLLSQICVLVTYWAVFALARSIVGAQHAALAVLLMVGIAAFTVPTPDFGPVILTMPLWAIALLHYWRAVGEGRRGYWLPLAIEMVPVLLRLRMPEAVVGNLLAWLRQIGLILAAHAGLLVLVALVAGWPWPRHDPAPLIVRPPIDAFARPLVFLSGLLVVVAAGEGIRFNRQHVVIAAWFGLLIIPPIMMGAALAILPW